MFGKRKKHKVPLDNKTRLIRWMAITGVVLVSVAMIGLIADQKKTTKSENQNFNNQNLLATQSNRLSPIPKLFDRYTPEATNILIHSTNEISTGALPSGRDYYNLEVLEKKYGNDANRLFNYNWDKKQLFHKRNGTTIDSLGWSISTYRSLPSSLSSRTNGIRVDFLNKWGQIAETKSDGRLWKTYYSLFDEHEYKSVSDIGSRLVVGDWRGRGFRAKDFVGVDLITGKRDKSKSPNPKKGWINRFGWGDIGALGETKWDDFYNSYFKITSVIKYYNSSRLYYSDGMVRDFGRYVSADVNVASNPNSWLGEREARIVRWNELPLMKKINEKYKEELTRLKKENPQRKIYGTLSSFKLWIPYRPYADDRDDRWGVEQLKIAPTSYKFNFYIDSDANQIVRRLAAKMNSFFPSVMRIITDDGARENSGGFNLNNSSLIAPGGTATAIKFNNQINEMWKNFFRQNNSDINKIYINGGFYIEKTSDNTFNLYLTIKPPKKRRMALLVKQNIFVKFEESDLYKKWIINKSMANRIRIIPGKTIRWQGDQFQYIDDQPFKLEEPDAAKRYGGAWLYHTNLTISFTTIEENEILFVNGKKVDVEDNLFELKLLDEIVLKQDSQEKERQNEYEIRLVAYERNDGINTSIKTDFTFKIVIQAFANDFKVSYFGWDPKFNPDQKSLITEFILDPVTQKPLLDKNGKPIPNPNYDPWIDPETGVKKQIIWVNKKSNDKNRLKFIPDPKDASNNNIFSQISNEIALIDQNKTVGFIAEAFVIPKGIQITDPNNLFGGPGTTLNKATVPIGQKMINNWSSTVYGNENTYFSKSGVYILTDDNRNSTSTIKLVGYGVEAKKPQLFTDLFIDNSEWGWKSLWDTYQGQHLEAYLKNVKNFEQEQIRKFSYSEISNYWKQYVFWSLKSNKFTTIIKPAINEQKVNQYTIGINVENFNPSDQELRSWLADFNHKDKISLTAELIDDQTIKIDFSLNSVGLGDFSIEPTSIFVSVRFKNSSSIDANGRTRLELLINEEFINQKIKSTRYFDFESNFQEIFPPENVLQANIDKINYDAVVTANQNLIMFRFWAKDEANYYLDANDTTRYFNNNLKNNSSDVDLFARFTINEFNLRGKSLEISEIKNSVIKFVKSQMPDEFVFEQDYVINWPDETKLEELKTMANKFDTQYPKVIINLTKGPEAKPNYFGSKQLTIYNIGDPNKLAISDLSMLKLNDLVYQIEEPEDLKKAIVNDLNAQLDEYDLELGVSVQINDLDGVVNAIYRKTGTVSARLIIEPIYQYLQNKTKVKVKNTHNNSNYNFFDLSRIKIPDLNLQSTNREMLTKIIENHINDYIYEQYGLEANEISIYYLNDKEKILFNTFNFYRGLVAKNPPEWTITKLITIEPQNPEGNLINKIEFNITNKSSSEPFNPDDDTDWNPPLNPTGPTDNNNFWEKQGGTILGGVFGSLGVLGGVFGGIFCSKFFFRNTSKRIK